MMNDEDNPNFPHEDYAILLGATAPGTASLNSLSFFIKSITYEYAS